MSTAVESDQLARLRWQCRRGLLEVEFLLNRFLDSRYNLASVRLQQRFEDLLDESDQVLLAWMMGQEAPDDVELQLLLELIRDPT